MEKNKEWAEHAMKLIDTNPLKIYIARYSTGSHGDYREWNVFVTLDKEKAQQWVDRFNTKLEKWKEYMISHRNPDDFGANLPDLLIFDRYWEIIETNEAFIEEIEVR